MTSSVWRKLRQFFSNIPHMKIGRMKISWKYCVWRLNSLVRRPQNQLWLVRPSVSFLLESPPRHDTLLMFQVLCLWCFKKSNVIFSALILLFELCILQCDESGQMMTYTLNKGWCGQIVVAVNNHRKQFFHIRTDLNGSLNVFCTRGFVTVDIIPPMHRYVYN